MEVEQPQKRKRLSWRQKIGATVKQEDSDQTPPPAKRQRTQSRQSSTVSELAVDSSSGTGPRDMRTPRPVRSVMASAPVSMEAESATISPVAIPPTETPCPQTTSAPPSQSLTLRPTSSTDDYVPGHSSESKGKGKAKASDEDLQIEGEPSEEIMPIPSPAPVPQVSAPTVPLISFVPMASDLYEPAWMRVVRDMEEQKREMERSVLGDVRVNMHVDIPFAQDFEINREYLETSQDGIENQENDALVSTMKELEDWLDFITLPEKMEAAESAIICADGDMDDGLDGLDEFEVEEI